MIHNSGCDRNESVVHQDVEWVYIRVECSGRVESEYYNAKRRPSM